MSAKPNLQESPAKPKSAMDLANLPTPTKQLEKTAAEISMKEFLDFLKISYRVNEAIDHSSSDAVERASVDWKKLTTDTLINRLKEREAVLKSKTNSVEKFEYDTQNGQKNENISGSEPSSKATSRQSSDETILERRTSTSSLDRKVVSDKLKRPSLGRKKGLGVKKEASVESETSRSLDGAGENRTPSKIIKKKLNEVLQEGIFDSVLPYLLPKQQQQYQDNSAVSNKKPQSSQEFKKSSGAEKNDKPSSAASKEILEPKRKLSSKGDSNYKRDIEVVIHVCDEIKNLKRDFKCSQRLLISQMGYFAEVTGGQKLEDMDISVHCDVTIFDWLMRWVQRDSESEENWPQLDCSIVIPVLMSSSFLQMNSLQEHCLLYCKNNINDIVKNSPNLNCINDNVLTRLANLFSNIEVEAIIDKKDKIQSKLFCKLIVSLSEPEPHASRGHFSSLATIYRCSKCLKLILRKMSGSMLCIPCNMSMDRNGSLHSVHTYDPTWNLTEYVKDLKTELRTWRKVYWKLWGDCHLLYCLTCEEYFPVHHMNWCRFHIESVQFFPLENQRSVTYPVGRYACCGEKAYRFEVIKKNSGCQYRDHIINSRTKTDTEVLHIYNLHKDIIKEDPPPLEPPEKVKHVKSSREEGSGKKSPVHQKYWWDGMEIIPSVKPSGFLNKFWDSVIKKEDCRYAGNNFDSKNQKLTVVKMVSQSQQNVQETCTSSDSSDESSSSSNTGNSEESCHSPAKPNSKPKSNTSSVNNFSHFSRPALMRRRIKRRKRKKKKNLNVKSDENRFWLPKLSTRCNQDNQREFEERALRQIESVLAKKLSGESFRTSGSRNSCSVTPAGGIYVKLEQQWREANCLSHGCPGSSVKVRGSTSFVNVNNSALSLQRRSKSRGYR